ncbi:glycine oxidase ThiO [Luethyella okanaganae]|uniref:glycine oxidase n=1 Tax=Luethyella okanaganae TaxID=69372 RepID=A0ABW1VFW3_9MICO
MHAASHPNGEPRADVAVVGGGIVGLMIAWELVRSDRTVRVIDPDPAGGASYAAAGMLAAVSELHYQEDALLALMLESAQLWPGLLDSLPEGTRDTGYRTAQTLVLGLDAADKRALTDLRAAQARHGLEVEPLSVREARRIEPMLSPSLSCAFHVAADHQVDPRRVCRQLIAAIGSRGGSLVRASAVALLRAEPGENARVTGVALDDGSGVLAGEVIVANGLGASGLGGLLAPLESALRPVHGDILRLRVPDRLRPLLTATVRGVVRGHPVYLVPRDDGTLVVGATSREDGLSGVAAGGVYQLLRDAQALAPAVAELELVEVTARARPGTRDNAPLLGRMRDTDGESIAGLVVATGFYRHGVLLSPVAADLCRRVVDGESPSSLDAFHPDRFSQAKSKEPV